MAALFSLSNSGNKPRLVWNKEIQIPRKDYDGVEDVSAVVEVRHYWEGSNWYHFEYKMMIYGTALPIVTHQEYTEFIESVINNEPDEDQDRIINEYIHSNYIIDNNTSFDGSSLLKVVDLCEEMETKFLELMQLEIMSLATTE